MRSVHIYALSMKFALLSGLLSVLLLLAIPTAFAHAGVMKTSGTTDIVLYQSPISPLVGERVRMTFVFTEHDKNDQIRELPVVLRLIDTVYGNEAADTVILKKDVLTDANGSIAFDHVFPKQNHFDVELTFDDPTGTQTVGFLVQPRAFSFVQKGTLFASGMLGGLLIALGLLRWRRARL